MPPKPTTPWSPETVSSLNARQQNPQFHPYTCGNASCYSSETHLNFQGQPWLIDSATTLVATPQGWQCPRCDYRQTWY